MSCLLALEPAIRKPNAGFTCRRNHLSHALRKIVGVLGLLTSGRPAAIVLRVIPVVVDPVERRCWRPFSHVCEKALKRIVPSLAHRYSSPAVSWIVFVVRVVAAAFHARPRRVGRRHISSSRSVAVSGSALASAGHNAPAIQVLRHNLRGIPAVALADPVHHNAAAWSRAVRCSNNQQLAESFTKQVRSKRHDSLPVIAWHT